MKGSVKDALNFEISFSTSSEEGMRDTIGSGCHIVVVGSRNE